MQSEGKKNENPSKSSKEWILSGFHMEADKLGNCISLSIIGVISIIDFFESSALMKTRCGKIKISGAELSVAVYENKTVEIYGKISAVEFL